MTGRRAGEFEDCSGVTQCELRSQLNANEMDVRGNSQRSQEL